jgi:hypothetical protein
MKRTQYSGVLILMAVAFSSSALFPRSAFSLTPEQAQKAREILQAGVAKVKEKYGQIQQTAQVTVAAALGAQDDCKSYGAKLARRQTEFVMLARLSNDIYERTEGLPRQQSPVAGSEEIRDDQGKRITLWFEPLSKGYAEVHHDALANAKVVVFRGTRLGSLKDLSTNLRQFVNIVPERYQWAAELVRQVKEETPGARIVATGHSLGGGLASYAALLNGQEAVVFNPAGFSEGVLATLPAAASSGNKNVVFIARSGQTLDTVSALSLGGETTMVGRRYLVDRAPGLPLLGIHSMEGLARELADMPEAATRCEVDLGFGENMRTPARDSSGQGEKAATGKTNRSDKAATAVASTCRVAEVKSKDGKSASTRRYCRGRDGHWELSE